MINFIASFLVIIGYGVGIDSVKCDVIFESESMLYGQNKLLRG
jgi:hypothetical protein